MVRLAGGLGDGDFEHLGRLRALRPLDSGGDELLARGPKPRGKNSVAQFRITVVEIIHLLIYFI